MTATPKHRRASPRKAAVPKRAPGRPPGDGADLRERLLDAAIACYVRTGIAGSSLRAIANEAAVTPAMLHYYFGDALQLKQAVIDERILPVAGQLRETLAIAGDDISALVTAFVVGVGEAVRTHPWFPSLWIREVLCEGGALREMLLHEIAPQLPRMLARRFAAAQAERQLNPDLDPRLLVVSLVGLTLFPAAGAPIWGRLFESEFPSHNSSPLDADALRRHTLALLEHGIGSGRGAAE